MARFDPERLAGTYAVAQLMVDGCLRTDGSLFTPTEPIWSRANFEELEHDYVKAPDTGKRSFLDKLRGQIGESSPGAIQLAAELLYTLYLPSTGSMGGDLKREQITEILSWLEHPIVIPDELATALDHGIGSGGPGFNLYRWAHLSYLVRFGLRWKSLTSAERDDALADPWAFHAVAGGIGVESGTFAHEALLHLVHPDTFERCFSSGDKWRLAERLSFLADPDEPDVDRRIAQVRQNLTERFGPTFDFYDDVPVAALWRPEPYRWNVFLYWCSRFRQEEDFDVRERKYKLELATQLEAVRSALLGGGDDWLDLLDKSLRGGQNLTDWRQHDTFLKWAAAEPDQAQRTMTALWEEGADPVAALSAFLDIVPRSVISTPGNRAGIGSVLLMGVDAGRCPPYRPTPLQRAYALTGSDGEEKDPADRYRRALAFFDRMIEDGPSVGLELRDRLDAQAVTWWLTSDDPPTAEWPEEDRRGLALFRGLLGGTPGPSLEESDFEVLDRNADGRSWTAISAEDQKALRSLRGKLGELATLLTERLPSEVALQPFTSILNPSGRAPKFYWICAYPDDSKNKSYAYQLFVIVHPEWIEVGFGSGSADSQLQDADLEADLRTEMQRARAALAATKGAPWTTGLERRARLVGHDFRSRWLEPQGRLLTGIETWLDASGEPGVAVSTFLSPEEVISLGDGLTSRLIKLLDPLVPLLEAAYVREDDIPVSDDPEENLTLDGLAEQLYLADSTPIRPPVPRQSGQSFQGFRSPAQVRPPQR